MMNLENMGSDQQAKKLEQKDYGCAFFDNVKDFLGAAKISANLIGKVYITLELNGDGVSAEVRMWDKQPKTQGEIYKRLDSHETIHYSPQPGQKLIADLGLAKYEEVLSAIRNNDLYFKELNKYDLTSGEGDVNGVKIPKERERAIKSSIFVLG